VFVAATAGLGAVAFAVDAGHRRLVVIASGVTAVLALAAAVHTVMVHREFPVLRILYIKGSFEARPLYEQWNSYSRVRVTGDGEQLEAPYGWGMSSAWPADRRVRQLRMDIDVSAGTVMTAYSGKPEEIEHLRYDVTNVGYYLRPGPAVAIIGAGDGRDVLSALSFGAARVTAIEINEDILRTVNGRFGDFTGHLDRDPRVRFVNDEARSYLARETDPYDMLQISLIDTWAATAAGAFVMSENAIYTREAWRTFLSRLTDTGVLSVSRWYSAERPGEVYRMVALATAALSDAGISDAGRHVLLVRNIRAAREREQPESVGTLLVSRSPFTAQDLQRLRQVAGEMAFEIVLGPEGTPDPALKALTDPRGLDAFTRAYPINITPPTDDSPFFFQMLRLRDLTDVALMRSGKNKHNMQAVFVLGVLTITVVALGVLCLMVPRLFARPRVALWPVRWFLLYFAGIGLGFMLIEISLMQRLIVLLGHPTYGLSVVLVSLLLGGGLGSLLTASVTVAAAPDVARRRLVWLLAAAAVVGVATPWLLARLEPAATSVRALFAGALVFLMGLMMGQAFPLGMRLAAGLDRLTIWLWAVNGAMSVCASVLAIVIALSWSISAAFWTGVAAYGLALLSVVRIRAEIPADARG
jgi:predicted membrane-bound spermidine synthase